MLRQSSLRLLAVMLVVLTGCSQEETGRGTIGFVEGFIGGLAADEPRAALVGRDVLSAGGSAADAVVATYFSMAVTYPVGAGLGGGGTCLIYQAREGRTEAISFLPGRPAASEARFAVPGNIRGMFLLHARYGNLAWSDLLIPAERFAREGHLVSRAFATAFEASRGRLEGDREAARVFGLGEGLIGENRPFRQVELGIVMANLRTRGPGDFYTGTMGRVFVDAVDAAGGTMTLDDLRNYTPQILDPLKLPVGNDFMYFPPAPALGGVVSGQVWGVAAADDAYEDAGPVQRRNLILEAGRRSFQALTAGPVSGEPLSDATLSRLTAGLSADRRSPGPGAVPVPDASGDGATIVAVDRDGQTVACSFTMRGAFGSGTVAPGTGMLLTPAENQLRTAMPSAAILANENVALVKFAAAGAGTSPAVLSRVALDTVSERQTFLEALGAPRAYDTGDPLGAVAEPGLPEDVKSGLQGMGYTFVTRAGLGRLGGFFCPGGIPRKEQTCQFSTDPRGHGLAVSSDQ